MPGAVRATLGLLGCVVLGAAGLVFLLFGPGEPVVIILGVLLAAVALAALAWGAAPLRGPMKFGYLVLGPALATVLWLAL